MKTLKLLLIALVAFITLAGTCEPEPIEEEACLCHIQGTKQISTDGGLTWNYAGTDERSGELFSCNFDSIYTNQENNDGILHRIFWKCND